MTNSPTKLIQKSTDEFLIFTCHAGEQSIRDCDEGVTVQRADKRGGLE